MLSTTNPGEKFDNQEETKSPEHRLKEVKYFRPGVKIGVGKFHPIELIIFKNDLFALKRIPKCSIDKAKRIEHLKTEKKICQMLNEISKKENT